MIEPKECKDMIDIRSAIDEIDNHIVKFIAKRAEGVYKASKLEMPYSVLIQEEISS